MTVTPTSAIVVFELQAVKDFVAEKVEQSVLALTSRLKCFSSRLNKLQGGFTGMNSKKEQEFRAGVTFGFRGR